LQRGEITYNRLIKSPLLLWITTAKRHQTVISSAAARNYWQGFMNFLPERYVPKPEEVMLMVPYKQTKEETEPLGLQIIKPK
jgi:hypothetical protein